MDTKRFFRYLAPNLVTLASLTFGMCSLVATIQGQFAEAGWFIVFSVLTDKLDGFVARLVKGTSEFGVQLEYETWHEGGIWNLRWLIDHELVDAPYFTSLFFGWPGGSCCRSSMRTRKSRRRPV